MKKQFLFIMMGFFFTVITNCGVKGKPQPPLTAPVLGRGEPSYSKATENVKLKQQKPRPSDWNEEEDFPEDKNQ